MNNSSSSRLVDELAEWVRTEPPGAQLPSTRTLVAQHAVSPVTVQKALRTLIARGAIESRPGIGTFVRAQRATRAHDYGWQTTALGARTPVSTRAASALKSTANNVIALHSGYPDAELLPGRLVRAAFTRATRTTLAMSQAPAAGLPELQSWFAAELAAAMAPQLTAPVASDVIILPGSQSGLSAVFRALVGAGNPILIESPSYWGAMLAAEQVGVQLVPIASGPHGPHPADVERAFAETGARAFYAQPNFANPTGAQWSPETAHAVLETARARGAFIIEDDWAHDFGIDTLATALASRDDSGHVVYLRSLTKSVSPAVRVGALISRGPARDRILAEVQAQSMYVSGVLQAAALDVVSQPGWQTHQRHLRHALSERRNLLINALREHAPTTLLEHVPPGGLNLWVRLPDRTDVRAVVEASERRGVIIAAGDEWFPAEPAAPYVRLNFSGQNPGAFANAARVLGEVLTTDS